MNRWKGKIINTWIAVISGNRNLIWWKHNRDLNYEKNQFYLLLIWSEFKFGLKNKNIIRLNRSKADTRTYKILFENDTARDIRLKNIPMYIHIQYTHSSVFSFYVWNTFFCIESIVKLVPSVTEPMQQKICFESFIL